MRASYKPVVPFETLLDLKSNSPELRDSEKSWAIHSEAWTLVHFLNFGPDMEQGKRLSRFFDKVQEGVDQKEAFREVFGSPKELEVQVEKYLHKYLLPSWAITGLPRIDDGDFRVRTMSVAETEAELARYYILSHHWKEMREFTEAALKHDPKLGFAHENMGYFQLNEGHTNEALREFSQALELDSSLYLSRFAKTMLSPIAKSHDSSDQSAFHNELLKVVGAKPDFAPAYVEIVKMYLRDGDLNNALTLARKAERLEPSRVGYHLLTARVLLYAGRGKEAAEEIAFIAERWSGVAGEEAMVLWDKVPVAQRPAKTPTVKGRFEADVRKAEGVVKSVTCQDRSFTIVLQQEGRSSTFHTQGTPFDSSDTLWWGKDHFTPCFNVVGLPAVVMYKPGSDKSFDGDLMYVLFRDDLPVPPTTKPTEASAESKP